jgi:hypothetical protein
MGVAETPLYASKIASIIRVCPEITPGKTDVRARYHWMKVYTALCCPFALSHTCMTPFIKVSAPYFPESIFIHGDADARTSVL